MNAEKTQFESTEISLGDVVDFLKSNRKTIALWGLVGLLLSIAFVASKPRKFEARWEIQMAQFASGNSEEPAALIQRLHNPAAYSGDVKKKCGLTEDGEFGEYLDGRLKAELVKTSPNLVSMRVIAADPGGAKNCAEAITSMIFAQQSGLIEERLAVRQAQLEQYRQALKEEQLHLEGVKKSELGNVWYVTKIEKFGWLRTRIDALQEEILLSRVHPPKLVAPIYTPMKPVSRHTLLALLTGVSFGLMLGLLSAMGRKIWYGHKSNV